MNIQQRRFMIRYRDYFMPVGLLVVCVLVFVGAIAPATQRVIRIVEEIQTQQAELTFLKKKLALLDALDEVELEEKLRIANSAIPVEKSLPSIMQTIENVAKEVGMTITSISLTGSNSLATESAKNQANLDQEYGAFSIPFNVTTSAKYDVVKSFLERTAEVRRFVRVRRFNLDTVTEEESQTQIGFNAFYLPLPKNDPNRILSDLRPEESELLATVENLPNAGELVNQSQPIGAEVISDPNRNPFAR